MKRLSAPIIEAYRKEIAAGRSFDPPRTAVFECPLGEWIDTLQGFAWAYRLRHGEHPKIQPICKHDRFNAQGLEGKISITTDLSTAIVMHSQTGPNRAEVYLL